MREGSHERAQGPRDAAEAEFRCLIAVSSALAAADRLEDALDVAAEETRRALGAASVSIRPHEGAAAAEYAAESAARLRALGEESAIGVPIMLDGGVWGSMLATSVSGGAAFGPRQLDFMEMIAGQLALALCRSERFRRISAMAFEDPLTGLANRRALDESVEKVVARALADGGDVALLFLDVDRLKEINDSFGHDAGDNALAHVATVLSQVARSHPDSLVARIGGDEFCVMLAGASVEAARELARRASDLLAEVGPPAVTLSSGASSLRSGAADAAHLFRSADAAQYAAKQVGRGVVFVAGEVPGTGLAEQTAIGRRTLRDRHASELQLQLGVTTALLDEVLAHAPVLDRLEAVAAGLARTLDAAEWAISFVPADGVTVSLLRAGYSRPAAEDEGSRYEGTIGQETYALDEYPLIARVVASGGAATVSLDDPDADENAVAFLDEWSYLGALAAASRHESGVFVVELFSDEQTMELAPAMAQLRLLVLAAVSGSVSRVRS